MTVATDKQIDDEEWLYRSFPVPDTRGDGQPKIHYDEIDGRLRFARSVWNDSNCQPSVDRKKLVKFPQEIMFNTTDAVIQIQVKQVRLEISGMSEGRQHDVQFDKRDARPAHSLIVSHPPFGKNNAEKNKWKEFQRLLSLAAAKHGWVVEPKIS